MIIYSILLLFLTVFIFYKLNQNSLLAINYYSFLFYYYIFFGVIGGFLIYSGVVDNTYFIIPIQNNFLAKEWGLFAICYGLFGIFLGILIVNLILNDSLSTPWFEYTAKNIYLANYKYNLFILLAIVIISSIYYIVKIHPSPLWMLFNGSDSLSVAIRRNEVTENFNGIGILKTISIIFSQILVFYVYTYYLVKKKAIVFLYIVFISVFFLLLLNIEKAPVLNLFLYLIVAYSYIKGTPKIKKIIYLIIFLIVLTICMYYFIMDTEINEVAFKILERLFVAQSFAPFLSFDYYLNHDYIYFNSMESSLFKPLIGDRIERASEFFMIYYYPGMRELGGWNVNGIYVHEAFSNFGYIGLFLGPIYVGIVNGIIVQYFIRQKKSILNLAFFVFFSVNVTSIMTSFNTQLLNTQSIMVFLILVVIYILNRRMY